MAMPAERVTHAISYLTGEVHALFMFSQALAMAYHTPPALLSCLNEVEQLGLARIETQPVGDAVVDGYQFVFDGVRKAVEAAAERSQNKGSG